MINIRPEVLEQIQKYIKDVPEQARARTKNDELYEQFLSLYPKEKILHLSMDEYCTGNTKHYPNNFSNWIENGLKKCLGGYAGRGASPHLIYKAKDTDNIIKVPPLDMLTDEQALSDVLKLHDLIINSDTTQDISWLADDELLQSKLGFDFPIVMPDTRKLRVLCAYHPNTVANIFSKKDMVDILFYLTTESISSSENAIFLSQKLKDCWISIKEKLSLYDELSIHGFIMFFYHYYKNDDQSSEASIETESAMKIKSLQNNKPLNQILYGPPGTGKTYKIQQIAKKYVEENFNEDAYLANIVKNISWLDVIIYAVLDIEKPCKLAEILKNRFYKAKLGNGKVNSAHIDQVLVTRAIRNPTNLDRNESTYPRREPLIFDRNMNNEWFIVDSEKEQITEYIAEYTNIIQQINNPLSLSGTESQNRYEIVTFHQSFSYEDFVEGIRAETTEDKQIKYEIKSGIFKEICDKARKEPNKKFAIFIDEINRGNIANIFGELITLIEPDKRQGCTNEMSITLPYSKQIFSVPKNLDIYGTMNTSDHSLTKLDLALRRRFEFVELLPVYQRLEEIEVHNVNIGDMLKIMNDRIEVLLGRDYLIGHSYFLPLKDAEDKEEMLSDIFKNKIIPLLQEYFFEDWERIQWVLNDQNKSQQYQFVHLLSEIKKDDIERLFKKVDGLALTDRRYQINKDAFEKAEAYSKILAE